MSNFHSWFVERVSQLAELQQSERNNADRISRSDDKIEAMRIEIKILKDTIEHLCIAKDNARYNSQLPMGSFHNLYGGSPSTNETKYVLKKGRNRNNLFQPHANNPYTHNNVVRSDVLRHPYQMRRGYPRDRD